MNLILWSKLMVYCILIQ